MDDILKLVSFLNHQNEVGDKEEVLNSLQKLLLLMDKYNNSNTDKFIELVEDVLKSIKEIKDGPLFFFCEDIIYTILVKILIMNKAGDNNKINCLSQILEYYKDHGRTTSTLIQYYNELDTFRVNGRSFRNYALCKVLYKYLESKIETKERTFEVIEQIAYVKPLIELLIRETDALSVNIILIYSYMFLGKIKVDLLKPCNSNEIKVDEDMIGVISKIFYRMNSLRKELKKKWWKEERIGETRPSEEKREVKGEAPKESEKNKSKEGIENSDYNKSRIKEKHRGRDKRGELGIKMKLITLDDQIRALTIVKELFNNSNIQSIIISIYKRLFFFFLFKNKRALSTVDIPRMFTETELDYIYKEIKVNYNSTVNIFKQVGHRYLVKYLESETPPNDSIFKVVTQTYLTVSELSLFYSKYMEYMDTFHHTVNIEILNPILFSKVFNSRVDIEITHLIPDCILNSAPYHSVDYLSFLSSYLSRVTKGEYHRNVSVELYSLLVDTVPCISYNTVLKSLYYITHYLNRGIISKLVPQLRKLVFYKEYALYAGLLYRKLYDTFQFRDEFFDTKLFDSHPNNNLVLASIGSKRYEDIYIKDTIDDTSFIYYLYHHPGLASTRLEELSGIISHTTPATFQILQFLLDTDPPELFTFCSTYINHFYHLGHTTIVLRLFLKCLRNKSVLPYMVIPYLMAYGNTLYIYRNYLETCLNCINDTINIVMLRIQNSIRKRSASSKEIEVDKLMDIFDIINKNNFIYTLSKFTTPTNIISRLQCGNSPLLIYIILSYISPFNKQSKMEFMKVIEESVSDERIYEMIEDAKKYYEMVKVIYH